MLSEFIRSEIFLYIVACFNILLLLLYISTIIKLNKSNKNYKKFIKKLGNGNNIEETLRKYIDNVEDVKEKNEEIEKFCSKIEKDISVCLKKVGLVRYSAFKDTGSDLSFALALLDENNNGVILNGIYSREMSNIYAKQIICGKANNTLSEEEKQALEKAMEQ